MGLKPLSTIQPCLWLSWGSCLPLFPSFNTLPFPPKYSYFLESEPWLWSFNLWVSTIYLKSVQVIVHCGLTIAMAFSPSRIYFILEGHFTASLSSTGKDWGQEEKWVTEDVMVGWHHQLNGQDFEQTLGDSEEQGNLACCSPWGRRVEQCLATEQQFPPTKPAHYTCDLLTWVRFPRA